MWAADNVTHANMLFYQLYYDIISLTSVKIIQAFHLLLGFAENQGVREFKIQNSVWITKGSDNRGPIVYIYDVHMFLKWANNLLQGLDKHVLRVEAISGLQCQFRAHN